MFKRLSVLRRKDKSADTNGVTNGEAAHSVNGNANGQANGTTNGYTNGKAVNGAADTNGAAGPKQGVMKRMSFARTKKQSVADASAPDHSVTRGDVDSSFEQFQQLVHMAGRPLPTQTGDGSYIEHEGSSSLFSELKTLGFKDFKTLREVISSKARGALTDDKTMIMERVIQASRKRPRVRDWKADMYGLACRWTSLKIKASGRPHRFLPQ